MNKNLAAMTPPMGFNTWDCYGAGVNEAQLLANAAYMRENLLPYGWEYVVCDIQWYEPTADSCAYHNFTELCMDSYSRLLPAENRFPSAAGGRGFAPIAEKIHAMGLKFGVHLMRGIPRQAVHRNTPTVTPGVTARDLAQGYAVGPGNTDMYEVNPDAPGAQAYYDSVFALFAQWGVDYVKVDDIANTEFKPQEPYSAAREIEMICRAIDRSGRTMVLSLSPGPAPLSAAAHLRQYANLWRMSGDFWDVPEALTKMFGLCAQWYPYVSPGCWPDCDMLPLGTLQLTEKDPRYRARKTRFTPEEQISLMNLWCIFRSPLMMGGELTLNDDFTLSLLTNRELLALDQASTENRPLVSDAEKAVWTCRDAAGRPVFAAFNLKNEPQSVAVDTGAAAPYITFDLWTKEKTSRAASVLTFPLAPRASTVFRIEA